MKSVRLARRARHREGRDRLWQIDLWRRSGLGELAEAFGSTYVEQDRATRLFVYRGDMQREWAAYGADARRSTEAFVAGGKLFPVALQSARGRAGRAAQDRLAIQAPPGRSQR